MAELEERLSHSEWIEWLAYMRMEASGSVPSSGSSWKDQMRTMRMISDMQKVLT